MCSTFENVKIRSLDCDCEAFSESLHIYGDFEDHELEVTMQNQADSGVRRWLGKILRLELTDGRIIEGKFVCTDNAPNIILSGCKEQWKDEPESRMVGLVMANGKHIRSIHEVHIITDIG
uniref:Sm domain-containing protein n=1 Tax=Setaria digitata TaxID=48799 RepID=A0A915PY29_9BILA